MDSLCKFVILFALFGFFGKFMHNFLHFVSNNDLLYFYFFKSFLMLLGTLLKQKFKTTPIYILRFDMMNIVCIG